MAIRAGNQWRQQRQGGLSGSVTGTFVAIGLGLHAKLANCSPALRWSRQNPKPHIPVTARGWLAASAIATG